MQALGRGKERAKPQHPAAHSQANPTSELQDAAPDADVATRTRLRRPITHQLPSSPQAQAMQGTALSSCAAVAAAAIVQGALLDRRCRQLRGLAMEQLHQRPFNCSEERDPGYQHCRASLCGRVHCVGCALFRQDGATHGPGSLGLGAGSGVRLGRSHGLGAQRLQGVGACCESIALVATPHGVLLLLLLLLQALECTATC